MAGMAGKLVEHPLDLVKTRLQTQSLIIKSSSASAGTESALFTGPVDCLVKTVRREGVLGLYQGIPSPMLGAILEVAALFFGYNQLKRHLLVPGIAERSQFDRLMLCGAGAGSLAALLINPFEVIKVQAQVHRLRHPTNASTYQLMRETLRRDGWKGLYRGFAGTLVREAGGGAVWFGTYEYACMVMADGGPKQQLSAVELVMAGATAGISYNFSFFPADVLKSIYQSRQQSDRKLPLGSLIRDIYRRQGIRGFYQGLGVTLIRAVPGNAAIFLTYEMVSQSLSTF